MEYKGDGLVAFDATICTLSIATSVSGYRTIPKYASRGPDKEEERECEKEIEVDEVIAAPLTLPLSPSLLHTAHTIVNQNNKT